ncbi:MAG: DUF2807 domain-containing protein [Myxococcota bacterium]
MRAIGVGSLLLVCLVGGGCEFSWGAGERSSRSLHHTGFDRVACDGHFDVEIVVGPEYSVTVVADDNLLGLAEVAQVGDQLVIDTRPNHAFSSRLDPKVVVEMPALTELSVGFSAASVTGLSGGDLTVTSDSHGDVTLAGQLETLRVLTSGRVVARALAVEEAIVHMRRGEVLLGEVRRRLETTGRGTIAYHGDPPTLALGHTQHPKKAPRPPGAVPRGVPEPEPFEPPPPGGRWGF